MITPKLQRFSIIVFFLLFLTFISSNQASPLSVSPQKISAFAPYQFLIIGDTRNTPDGDNSGVEIITDIIDDLLANDSLDIQFAIHSGDVVDSGAEQNEWDTYYWPEMADINATIPIYYAAGNHEYSSLSGDDTDLVTFRANVNNPGNEIYYSFDTPQNDIHFIVLNTEFHDAEGAHDRNETRRQAQLDWFAADVTANTIDQIVVMFHRPIWGINPGRYQEYESLRAELHDLLIESGVDLVVNGHDHLGYHTIRNHSTGGEAGYSHFLVSGGGTAALTRPIPDFFNPALNPSGPGTLLSYDFWYEGNEICLANVTEDGMYIDMIGADGSVVYSFNTVDTPPNHIPFEIDTTTDMTTTTTIDGSSASTPGFELEIVITSFTGIVAVMTLVKKKFWKK